MYLEMKEKAAKIVLTIILALIMILYGTVFVTSAVKSQNDYCNHEYKTYETEEFEHNSLEYDYPNFDESENTEPSYHPQNYQSWRKNPSFSNGDISHIR